MKVYTDILSRCIWMALLVMLLLFPVTAIGPLKFSSTVGVATPVSADGGSGWTGSWIKEGEPGFPNGPKNMELTQSGNNVTGYNYDNGRKVACMVDPGNPNVARGNWDASNRMLAEMTLSADGQTITARTKFVEMDHYFATQTYTRKGPGTTPGTVTPPSTGACTGIEGTWDVQLYTSPGHMDVTRSGSGYTGHVYLVSWLGLETLKNITYDPQTGAVSFYRDSGNQTYTGTLSGNSMSGTFIDLGHPGYQWSATRTCASTETGTESSTGTTADTVTATGAGWSGDWTIVENMDSGAVKMTLTQSGNKLTGYSWAAGRSVACLIDSSNPNIARGNWDASNRMISEMTLSPDGQSITVVTGFSDSTKRWTYHYVRQGSGAGSGTGTTGGTGAGTTTGTGSTPNTTGTGAMLVAESRIADPNSTVQVPIRLNNASNIGSMNFVLTYNAQVLKVSKVDGGSLLNGALFTPNYTTPPVVRFGLATSGGLSGSATLAYIQFQVIGAAGSSSPLTLSEVDTTDMSGKAVAVTTQNGTVTVTSGVLGGAGGKTKGDYNGDGKVTELDALAALKMSVKLLSVDLTLDMDGNGKVTAEDARLILKKAVGK